LVKADIGQSGHWLKWTLAEADIGRSGHWPKQTLAEADIGRSGHWPKLALVKAGIGQILTLLSKEVDSFLAYFNSYFSVYHLPWWTLVYINTSVEY
jgi:hypothetical protein